jgi:hypothetical protein
MFPAGKYNVEFRWMQQQNAAPDTTYGQSAQSWAFHGTLWGYILGEAFVFNTKGSQNRAEIHLRGLPAVSASDKIDEVVRGMLINGSWVGYRWTITGIRQDAVNNELVLEVFR